MKLYCETCKKFLDYGDWHFETPHDPHDMYSGEIVCDKCGETLIV